MTKPKPPTDWERIELDYRSGVLTLREIASRHGLTHGAINKRAKRDGWTRDLSAKIKAKAEALVSRAPVSAEVSAAKLVTENEAVEVGARVLMEVKLGHQAVIRRGRTLVEKLLAEVEGLTDEPELVEQLKAVLEEGDLKDAVRRVAGLSGRIANARALADTLAKLIPLERRAFGLDEDNGKGSKGTYEETLSEVYDAIPK